MQGATVGPFSVIEARFQKRSCGHWATEFALVVEVVG